MQMSLGKFTEQLVGSEAPASVTSPPARHSPRFAKRSKGLTGARQQEQTHSLKRAWKSCGWHTLRVPPVTIIFTKMISFSVYTCHPQNGWWVFRFLLWNINFLNPRFFPCVCACVCEDASLVSLDIWLSFYPVPRIASQMLCDRSTPFISVILHPDLASAAQRHIQLLHTQNDH